MKRKKRVLKIGRITAGKLSRQLFISLGFLMLLPLFVMVFQSRSSSGTQAQGVPIPSSFVCGGSGIGSVCPSGGLSPAPSTSQPSIQPCLNTTSVVTDNSIFSVQNEHHYRKRKGTIQQLLQKLIELIQQLLSMLGGGSSNGQPILGLPIAPSGQPISGVPSVALPSTQPISAAPSMAQPSVPAVSPCPSANPASPAPSSPQPSSAPSSAPALTVIPSSAPSAAAPVTGQLALIFDDGKLASDYSAQAAASMLQKSPFKFKTEFVGPGHTALTAQLLQQAKLFVQPGGSVDTGTAKQDFAAEIPLVNQFVNNGGRYLGLCAGGFVAGKEGYGVFPGKVGSYAGSPGTVAKGSSDQLIPVLWKGKTVTIDWEDGNYFDIPAGTPGVTIMGTYTNGLTAAAVATYGKGKSAFIGPHVESGLGSNPPDAASLDLGFQLLQVLMN